MAKHDRVEMVWSHRSNAKHRHSGNRGIRYCNHWFNVYRCPVCGRTASHKRKPIICTGKED